MSYSKEVNEYIDYVVGNLKKGKYFSRGAVENFALETGVPVENLSREIVKRAGAPVNKIAGKSIASLETLASIHEMSTLPENADKVIKTMENEVRAQRRGFENQVEYQKALAQQNGYKNSTEYQNAMAKKKGYKNRAEYEKTMLEKRGYKNRAEYRNAMAKKRGYKNKAEYEKTMALNKMVPLTRALFDAGLSKKQVRIMIKSTFSKTSAGKYSKKAVEKAEQSREIISKGFLLTGKVEAPKKRRRRV